MSMFPSIDFTDRDSEELPLSRELIDLDAPDTARMVQSNPVTTSPRGIMHGAVTRQVQKPVPSVGFIDAARPDLGPTVDAAFRFGRDAAAGAYDSLRGIAIRTGQGVSDAMHGISRGLVDLEGTSDMDTSRAESLAAGGDPMGRHLLDQADMANAYGREGFRQSMRNEARATTPGADPNSWGYFFGNIAGSTLPSIAGVAGGPVGMGLATLAYGAQAFEEGYDRTVDTSVEQTGDYNPETAKAIGTVSAGVAAILERLPMSRVAKAADAAMGRMVALAAKGGDGWRKAALGEIGRLVALGSGQEAVTEGAQQVAEEVLNLSYDQGIQNQWVNDPKGAADETSRRVLTAMAAGGIGGGGIGAAGAGRLAGIEPVQPNRAVTQAIAQGKTAPAVPPLPVSGQSIGQSGQSLVPTQTPQAVTGQTTPVSATTPTVAPVTAAAPAVAKTAGSVKAPVLYSAAFKKSYAESVESGTPRKVTPSESVDALARKGLWPKTRDPDNFILRVLNTPGYEPIAAELIRMPSLSRDVAHAMFRSKAPKTQAARNEWLRLFRDMAFDKWPDGEVPIGGLAAKALAMDVPVPLRKPKPPTTQTVDPLSPDEEADAAKRAAAAIPMGRGTLFQAEAQDAWIQVERMERKIREAGFPLSESGSVTNALRLAHGREVERNIQAHSEIKSILKDMRKNGVTAEEVVKVGIAEHSPERNDAIARATAAPETIGAMTNEKAKRVLQEAQAKPNWPHVKSAVDRYRKLLEDGLRSLSDSGLVSPEQSRLFSNYRNYWPLMDDPSFGDPDPKTGKPGKFSRVTSKIRGSVGREIGSLDSPSERTDALINASLANVNAMIHGRIGSSERSRVFAAMRRFAMEYGGQESFQIVDEIPTEPHRTKDGTIERQQVPGYLERPDVLVGKADESFTSPGGKEHAKGDRVIIEVADPALGESLKNSSRMDESLAGQIYRATFGLGRNIVRFTSTRANIAFWTGQVPMDLQDSMAVMHMDKDARKGVLREWSKNLMPAFRAMFESENVAVPMRRSARAERMALRVRQFKELGGMQGIFSSKDFVEGQDFVQHMLNPTKRSKAKYGLREIVKWIDSLGVPFESASRIAYFDALINAGVSPDTAAVRAKDLQINFEKRGRSKVIEHANIWQAFVNARIQGIERTTRLFSRRGAPLIGAMILQGFLEGLMRAYVGGEDEDKNGRADWLDVPEWEKNSRIILPTPIQNVVGKPKVGWILNVPRLIGLNMAAAITGDKEVMQAAKDMAAGIADTANPIGGSGAFETPYTFMRQFIPATFQPFADIGMNEDYRGRPISSRYAERGAVDAYNTDGPSSAAKATAQNLYDVTGLDVAPESLSYLTSFVTGGIGRTIERTGRAAHAIMSDDEDLRVDDLPVVRDWFGSVPNASATAEDYYRMRDRVDRFSAEVAVLRDNGRSDEADAMLADNPELVSQYQTLYHRKYGIERQLQKLREERRDLRRAGLDDSEIRKRMEVERANAMRQSRQPVPD